MKQVTIVGAGALGSHVVLFGREWDADITVIDFDRIEKKNTQSQFHTVMGLRRNKAEALKMAMQGMFKRAIRPVTNKLTEDNVAALLGRSEDDAGVMGLDGGGTTLVIDCTDNAAARRLIQDYCRGRGIDCLHGCLSADGTFARVVWTEHFKLDEEGEEGEATCEDGENLPFHGLAGSVLAMAAQTFLTQWVKRSYQLTGSSITRIA